MLEEGSLDLCKFSSNATSKNHSWLPRIMRIGVHIASGTVATPNSASLTTAATDLTHNSANNNEDNDEDREEDKVTHFSQSQ